MEDQSARANASSATDVQRNIEEILGDLKSLEGVELTRETRFQDLGLTSLDLLVLTFELEERWEIAIKDSYQDDYRTIGEAVDTVLQLLTGSRA